MAQTLATFDTAHTGPLHDAQLDYYGKRLATASSDHTIRIWDVSTNKPAYLAELRIHKGPVWQICWAHPKFGGLLASCSYDGHVVIWREVKTNIWDIVHINSEHTASVNSVAWAPWQYQLQLACASSDGNVSVLTHKLNSGWTRQAFQAHANGVTAVSWSCPNNAASCFNSDSKSSSLTSTANPSSFDSLSYTPKLVTGGCDNQVRVWGYDSTTQKWNEIFQMTDKPHTDWVRDVSWRPNVGIATSTIASCSEDQTVILWTQEHDGQPWKNSRTIHLGGPIWRVSWSVTGTVLAVSSGDNRVTLFKENADGIWEKVTNLNEQNINTDSNIFNEDTRAPSNDVGSARGAEMSHRSQSPNYAAPSTNLQSTYPPQNVKVSSNEATGMQNEAKVGFGIAPVSI